MIKGDKKRYKGNFALRIWNYLYDHYMNSKGRINRLETGQEE